MKTLDQLQGRTAEIEHSLALLNANAAPIRKELGDIDRKRAKLVQEKTTIEARIADMKKAPRVSDHAVIRYLERKHGFDFEAVRESLLTPAVLQAMAMGAEGVKVDGGTLKIARKCITTFIGNGPNGGDTPKAKRRQVLP